MFGMGYHMFGWCSYFPILLFGILIVGLIVIIGFIRTQQSYEKPLSQDRQQEILDFRYAKGEISKEQYLQISEDIQ